MKLGQIFEKYSHKISWECVHRELIFSFWIDRRTDMKIIVTFRDFVNSPKNVSCRKWQSFQILAASEIGLYDIRKESRHTTTCSILVPNSAVVGCIRTGYRKCIEKMLINRSDEHNWIVYWQVRVVCHACYSNNDFPNWILQIKNVGPFFIQSNQAYMWLFTRQA